MLKVTEKAVKEVKHIMKEQDLDSETHFLRLGVKGGGCSGFSYALDITEEKTDKDEEFEFETSIDKRATIQNNVVMGILKDGSSKSIQLQEIKEIHYRESSEIKTTFLVLGIAAAVAWFVLIFEFDSAR